MGKVNNIIEILEHNKKFYDDQYGLSDYMKNNCNKIIIDDKSDIILDFYDLYYNLEPTMNRFFNKTLKNFPSVIHLPAQFFRSEKRSEYIRNEMFKNREKIPNEVYFNNLLKNYQLNLKLFIIIIIIGIIGIIGIYYSIKKFSKSKYL